MPITPLDNDEPFARQLTHDPATMVRALAWAAALFALGGVAVVAVFPWNTSLSSESWRGTLFFATLLPAYYIAGVAICILAAVAIRLLQHLRRALQPDIRAMRFKVTRRAL